MYRNCLRKILRCYQSLNAEKLQTRNTMLLFSNYKSDVHFRFSNHYTSLFTNSFNSKMDEPSSSTAAANASKSVSAAVDHERQKPVIQGGSGSDAKGKVFTSTCPDENTGKKSDGKDEAFFRSASMGIQSTEVPLQPNKKSRSLHSSETFEDEWQKIEILPLKEKRKLYKCKQFYTLESILPWSEFSKIVRLPQHPNLDDVCEFDEELNNKVSLFYGDITGLEIDVIVNAANSSLLGGGGVDGAIHRAAGSSLLKQCRTLRGCRTGQAKISYGFQLPAKRVIHTVGPMDGCSEDLIDCYNNSLKLAMDNRLRTIAFPCISTGIYGFPNEKAARLVLKSTRQFLENHRNAFDRIIFVLFMDIDKSLYLEYMQVYFPKQTIQTSN